MPKPKKSTWPLDPNHESSDEGKQGNKLTAMLDGLGKTAIVYGGAVRRTKWQARRNKN